MVRTLRSWSALIPQLSHPEETMSRRPGVVLAVDDVLNRVDMAANLVREGFDVWTAGNGIDALELCAEHLGYVDAVVIESDMADLPGLTFYRRLYSHFPDVRCLFLGRRAFQVALLQQHDLPVLPGDIGPDVVVSYLNQLITVPVAETP